MKNPMRLPSIASGTGPWVLVITAGGMGKRVPVSKFRLQNRAGMGLQALKFRKDDDSLVALWWLPTKMKS
jgi:DNA gyrase/topoisomerase IV subunit A